MIARRLAHLSVILLLTTLSCQFIQSLIPSEGNSSAVDGALLNEVLFLPAQGEAGFVEIKSPGKRVSLEWLYLMNERGDSYLLPQGVNALSPDEFLLIVFDGTNIVEDQTIHAGQTGFLNPESGFIELYASDETLLDRVAWGTDQPGDVRLSRGGVPSDFGLGVSIGRFPASFSPANPHEWVIFFPEQATPGAANPNPGVRILLPLDGAILDGPAIRLSWYPIAGAASYHLQAATDEAFTSPLIDETVTEPVYTANALPAGEYFWRVQAIAADGTNADYSPAQSFRVGTLTSSLHLARPARQKGLNVPWFSQRKDTGMLLLESKMEEGDHRWDVDHKVLDPADPADNSNCTLASVSMVNAYYHNSQEVKLSQDRIGYELYKGGGPEEDLNYDKGAWPEEVLPFALGAPSRTLGFDEMPADVWEVLKSEIDLGRPIIIVQNSHTVVITGYHEGAETRWVMINDPWSGQYAVDSDHLDIVQYSFLPDPKEANPASDEPEIRQDSDGDGIVDFDEINRFKTDPNPGGEDTDKDNLKDKDDLRASIFDKTFGYAVSKSMIGRDFDSDGLPMELDEDSDSGGCFDGMEDYSLDGRYTEPETYNFDPVDDACFWGTDEAHIEDIHVDDDGSTIRQIRDSLVKFSLRVVGDGKLEGLAQARFTATGATDNPDCPGTYDGGTTYWQARLEGSFQKFPDGSTLVSFEATPIQGPPVMVIWITPCPGAEAIETYGAFAGSGGMLKDGVYDMFVDLSPMYNGESWQKTHMEQGDVE